MITNIHIFNRLLGNATGKFLGGDLFIRLRIERVRPGRAAPECLDLDDLPEELIDPIIIRYNDMNGVERKFEVKGIVEREPSPRSGEEFQSVTLEGAPLYEPGEFDARGSTRADWLR